mmetsp:Transcript_16591/g.29032  ORF Transcript_16591/g.29032 Transcript_16591/m.29032 type:complete len:103 (+) Transcript_16591:427-735(+)
MRKLFWQSAGKLKRRNGESCCESLAKKAASAKAQAVSTVIRKLRQQRQPIQLRELQQGFLRMKRGFELREMGALLTHSSAFTMGPFSKMQNQNLLGESMLEK